MQNDREMELDMKVAFMTLGCKVNFYETEKMMEKFQQAGFEVIEKVEKADIFVINTCTVTNMADRKSRQMIHRGKKKNKDMLVAAVGCYVESDAESLKNDEQIDLVLGNKEKKQIVEHVLNWYRTKGFPEYRLTEGKPGFDYDFAHERTRAFVKVQDGCNQFCTYCIIPYVRGRLKSREQADVINEIEQLAQKGFKEVVITGIHLSSYGVDKSECKSFLELDGKPLLILLEEIEKIPQIRRIRLGSLEPRIITENFLARLSKNKKICPHFHLSLQSGCNETLKRMNRHYTVEEYKEKCELIRHYFKYPAITTDVIVGFPGEDEKEFQKTKAFLEEIQLADIHVFKYSVRSGTKAASMENQVPESEKTVRSNMILQLARCLYNDYAESFIGKNEKVLWEEFQEKENEEYLTGHNERYVKIAVPKKDAIKNAYRENEVSEVYVRYVIKKS